MFDYEVDFYGCIARVAAASDAKAKYVVFKGFKCGFDGDGMFPGLDFKRYIKVARIVRKVRKIA